MDMASIYHIPVKSRVLEAWEPVIGHPAAVAMYRAKWVVQMIRWVALAYFVLVFVTFHTARSSAVAVAWVAGLAGAGFSLSAFYFLRQWRKEAGRALGIKITGKNAPPSDPDLYLQWCRSNGVQPLTSRKDSPH
jgi:hypothetical protein